jgi:hypothetical protein
MSIVAGATDLRLRVSRSGERSTHRIAAPSYWSSSRLPVNQNPPVAKCSPRFHCSAARRGPNPVREYRHRPGARSSLPGADSHPSEAAASRQGRCREDLCFSEFSVTPQHGAAHVQGPTHRRRTAFPWPTDGAAAPQFPCRTVVHGHRLTGIQRQMAAPAQAFGVRCGGIAVRQVDHGPWWNIGPWSSFRECGAFSSYECG